MSEGKGLSYFFLGLGVGVAVGIIFAPKSGRKPGTCFAARLTRARIFCASGAMIFANRPAI